MSIGCTRKNGRPVPRNEGINRWYEIGRENGAVGGKLVGAGGGGFLLFYADDRDALRRAMVNEGLQRVPLQIRSRRLEAAVAAIRVRRDDPMQCVILAGGLGNADASAHRDLPKTLLPARGRPFAWHQLHWLAAQGITEVIYSIGHQGDMIRRYWAEEAPPVPSIRYVDEGEQLRGTAGALRLARDQGVLDESFFVIYGDSFLPVEFDPVWRAFQASGQPALMTVLRNEGRWDRSNVIYQPGRVMLYDKAAAPGMQYIDYGLSCFRRAICSTITRPPICAVLFHQLSVRAGWRASKSTSASTKSDRPPGCATSSSTSMR